MTSQKLNILLNLISFKNRLLKSRIPSFRL